jgi:hypothetical protein
VAYDEDLADRIREQLSTDPRVDPAQADRLVDRTAAEPMVMRGRPMTGWLRVHAEAVRTKAQLTKWVYRGVEYARTLPAKQK